MKINLDTPVLDYEGKPVLDESEDKKQLTFREIVHRAINVVPREKVQTSEEKVQIFQLGIKLFSKKLKEYDLTTDQITFLSKQIDLAFGALVVGRWKQLIGDLKEEEDGK